MEPSWWIIGMGTVIAMVSSFVAYFCGCCRKIPRDELLGVSGIVKITNPDAIQNNNSPVAISITKTPSNDSVPMNTFANGSSMKRLNDTRSNGHSGTATRSLPELPVDASIVPSSNKNGTTSTGFICYTNGDTNSDLYATLEEHKIATSASKQKSLVSTKNATTYERIDDDGFIYNKVEGEHPYAQVEDIPIAGPSRIEHSPVNRRNSDAVDEVDGILSIPAASAIAGSVAASNELPYMTPPIHGGEHFSGDSQDSTKGYTSITVREPLSHIRSQQIGRPNLDSHYTVLSDDSDEMYAAIQDAYTSGSETYAQIQPVTSNATYSVVPDPPLNEVNVSPRYSVVSVHHSRQASTSSVTSFTNRNSPKEKRQANSPLPKPPDLLTDNMYAKVLKKRKADNEWINSRDSNGDSASNVNNFYPTAAPSGVSDLSGLNSNSKDNVNDGEDDDPDKYGCGYETLPDRKYEKLEETNHIVGYETVKETDSNPGYESLPEPDSLTPGYERIREPDNYEKLKYTIKEDETDPNYEELKPQTSNAFHCYATIDKSNKTKHLESRKEPDYASLTRNSDAEDALYERINKHLSEEEGNTRPDTTTDDQPNDDNNNNHSDKSPDERIQTNKKDDVDLSELYSKVNKTKR